MKIPAYPELSRRAPKLLIIPLGLLLLHLTYLPALADDCTPPATICPGGYCGVETAIGCIPVNLGEATGWLFGLIVEIIGLLALILFTVGGYRAMTSGDNPEALQDAKAQMTAAVAGFFFLLLFVKIITIIGINILGITPLCHVLGTC